MSPTADTDTEQRQAVLARLREEQARQVLTIGAVRAHLEEQPSARSVRACARMWCSDITNLAETVIKARNSTETE